MPLSRREFCLSTFVASSALFPAASIYAADQLLPTKTTRFELNYIVASCMYGTAPLAAILPEVAKTRAKTLELWASPHGNQREQVDELGEAAVLELFRQHAVQLGSITCFKYGIFNMQSEIRLAQRLGGDMVICNSGGPKNPSADDLKSEVRKFVEKLKPQLDLAEDTGVVIGVENHGGGLINSPESIRYLFDTIDSKHLGLAMAPYHLPQDPEIISQLILDLGPKLVHFQAWEHGMGCTTKLPKEQELLQLPHRGPLDWKPLLAALAKINYQGRTEIFMHPVPRGIPILPEISEVTAEINAARIYLENLLPLT